jgi:hypothetical protein
MMTSEQLKKVIAYDPETGIFIHRARKGRKRRFLRAGCTSTLGYTIIKIGSTPYRAGRLAWLYMTGKWPENDIDHINRIRNDDRFCNLREATRSQNHANAELSSYNSSGLRGVSMHQCGKWQANIRIKGKLYYLGLFDTAEDAHEVYEEAAKRAFGEFHKGDSD